MFDIFSLPALVLVSTTTLSRRAQQFFDPSESWKLVQGIFVWLDNLECFYFLHLDLSSTFFETFHPFIS